MKRIHLFLDDGDPLGKYNLIFVKNPLWRTLREKLSPFFSSGKLKNVFYIMDEMSSNLVNYIENSLERNGIAEHNVRELAAMYTTGH